MVKAKKEVDLKTFKVTQVDNGWLVEVTPARRWWEYEEKLTNTYVFVTMDDLLNWIEVNV